MYQRILLRLGVFSNIYECTSKDKQFSYYALNINEKEMKRYYDENSSREWFRYEDNIYLKVKQLKKTDILNQELYNITTENNNNTVSCHYNVLS